MTRQDIELMRRELQVVLNRLNEAEQEVYRAKNLFYNLQDQLMDAEEDLMGWQKSYDLYFSDKVGV